MRKRMSRLLFVTLGICYCGFAIASDPVPVVTGQPMVDRAVVEQFSRAMKIAQAKVSAAATALQGEAAQPEGAPSTQQAMEALSFALQQGSNVINAEKEACAQTDMPFELFQQVRMRLLQVRMYEKMVLEKERAAGAKTSQQMEQETIDSVHQKQKSLQEQVQRSEEALAKAKTDEATHFSRLDEKIAEQHNVIRKLESDLQTVKTDKQKTSKERQLIAAREKQAKLEQERRQPFRRVVSAEEKLQKDQQKLTLFEEQMPLVIAELRKNFVDLHEAQQKNRVAMEQLEQSDLMQQAKLDKPVFDGFPDLPVFAAQALAR